MPSFYAAPHLSLLELARGHRARPTLSEHMLWQALRGSALGVKFRREHVLAPFIVDFYASRVRLVIEVDGAAHWDRAARDASRTLRLVASHGVRVVRIEAWRVERDLPGVLAQVRRALGTRG